MIDIIKNPVIIGLTVGILVYLYLKWDASKRKEDKNKRKDSNLLIPLFIGVATWFISNNYFEKYNFDELSQNNLNNNIDLEIPTKLDLTDAGMTGGGANIVNNIGNKFTNIQPPTYHLLKRGVTIPNNMTLPEIMIDNF
jgi:multisubunit Na+/H+ antiporter MnhB subunit